MVSVDPGPVILGSTLHVRFSSDTQLPLGNVNREIMSPLDLIFSSLEPFLT